MAGFNAPQGSSRSAPAPASTAVPGTHTVPVRGTDFTVDARYTPTRFVGCGSYGVVCAALDTTGNWRPRLPGGERRWRIARQWTTSIKCNVKDAPHEMSYEVERNELLPVRRQAG